MEPDVQRRKWLVLFRYYLLFVCICTLITKYWMGVVCVQIDEAADRYGFMAKVLDASWLE